MNKRSRNIIAVAAAAAMAVFGFAPVAVPMAHGDMLPFNTYLQYDDLSDAYTVLDGMDGVEKHPDAYWSQPTGEVRFTDGSYAPAGIQLWFIAANDRQVVGELDMDSFGGYNFLEGGPTYGIYGDDNYYYPDTGAAPQEPLMVLAFIDGVYYKGWFEDQPLSNGYEYTDGTDGWDDIIIDLDQPVPVFIPAAAPITLLAAGMVALLRRRRPRNN